MKNKKQPSIKILLFELGVKVVLFVGIWTVLTQLIGCAKVSPSGCYRIEKTNYCIKVDGIEGHHAAGILFKDGKAVQPFVMDVDSIKPKYGFTSIDCSKCKY